MLINILRAPYIFYAKNLISPFLLIAVILCISCITNKKICNDELKISLTPSLEKNTTSECYAQVQRLMIPPQVMLVSKIKRPSTELREGPGTNFKIQDKILEKDTEVIIFDKYNSWVKIYIMNEDILGWVHANAIYNPELNSKELTISKKSLPKVFAIKNINTGYEYPSNKTINVNFVKGTVFFLIRKDYNKSLVYIETTNSLIWFLTEEVQ